MVRWLPWRRGPDYEHELPRLAAEIRDLRLKEISAANANRRWPTLFVQHSLSLVVLYAAYAILFASSRQFHLSVLAAIPFLLAGIAKAISYVTRWRLTKIQAALKLVVDKRKTLVDAYKKKVKFDEVMSLIGDESDEKKEIEKAKSAAKVKSAAKANSAAKAKSAETRENQSKGPKPVESHGGVPEFESFDGPVPVYQTSWIDRILDVIIGVNENSPAFRYALICPHCHAHNGLAPYGKLAEETSYFCRVCHEPVVGSKGPKLTRSVENKLDSSTKAESDTDEDNKEADNSLDEVKKSVAAAEAEAGDAKAEASEAENEAREVKAKLSEAKLAVPESVPDSSLNKNVPKLSSSATNKESEEADLNVKSAETRPENASLRKRTVS